MGTVVAWAAVLVVGLICAAAVLSIWYHPLFSYTDPDSPTDYCAEADSVPEDKA